MKNLLNIGLIWALFSSLALAQPVNFVPSRGFYNSPLQLQLSTNVPGAVIYYTLDGKVPTTASAQYTTPISVQTTSVVRALAWSGGVSGEIYTHTYLFTGDVVNQPDSIAGWPLNSYPLGSGAATAIQDYEMDPAITQNANYTADLLTGLCAIPTLSVVMDRDQFWEMNDGDDSRPASFELLHCGTPSADEQFNAAIESHSHLRVKRSYEIIPGPGGLTSDLFSSAPLEAASATRHFGDTKIVLRAGNNDAWSRNWNPNGTTYSRDEWYRASQLAINGYGSHGSFVHLYINGVYWGLYNPVERPDEGFDAEYFGGQISDWLSFNHDGIRNGNATRYNYLANTLVTQDLSDPAKYTEFKSYLDVESFCDYLILSWMPGMADWPENNFYGAMRNNPAEAMDYLAWDGEWTWTSLRGAHNGAWVSPPFKVNATPGGLITKLWKAAWANPDFRITFADRVYALCFNEGPMSDANSRARWAAITNSLNTAIVAESARWGDATGSGTTRTKITHWLPEVQRIDSLMSGNVPRFVTALLAEGYYPSLQPPTFSEAGGTVLPGLRVAIGNLSGGQVYFTTDGSDPRLSGGGIAPQAQLYNDSLSVATDLALKARVYDGSNWSPAASRLYSVLNLKINEFLASNVNGIRDPADNANEDWVEIYNAGTSAVDVAGMYLTDVLAVPTTWQFPSTDPASTTIPAGGFLLVWADNDPSEGPLHATFKLSKGGEALGLSRMNPDASIVFLDAITFGPQADDVSTGRFEDGGPVWRSFSSPTPGAPNKLPFTNGLFINEFMASNTTGITDENGSHEDWVEIYNAGDVVVNLAGFYITDDLTNPSKLWQVPATNAALTTVPGHGHLLLWADGQPAEGPHHLNLKLGKGGEALGLVQILGTDTLMLDSLTFGPQADNISQGRLPDGGEPGHFFHIPTPGAPNVLPFVQDVYINEVMAINTNGITDETGNHSAWVEIYNGGNDTINLAGYYLTAQATNLGASIPFGNSQTMLPPGGQLIFWADGQPLLGTFHLPLTLGLSGKLFLVQAIGSDTKILDSLAYGPALANISLARYPDGSPVAMKFDVPTPGAPNIRPDISGLFINEFLASNKQSVTDAQGEHEDWIEIYNANSYAVNLAGLFITDDLDDPRKYQFPATDLPATAIPPFGFILLWADGQPEQGARHIVPKLSTDGEQIGLVQVNGSQTRFIDSLSFGLQTSDVSLGRLPDGGPSVVTLPQLTPGGTNVPVGLVESFTLIDAVTDLPIRSISENDTINIALLPHTQIAIRANTLPVVTGSVRFILNALPTFSLENGAPYSLTGDKNGDYKPWNYQIASYNLTAIPYSRSNGGGEVGISLTRSFTIINQLPTAVDCHGDLGGSAFLNTCGICVGGQTGLSSTNGQDCNGDCNGTAILNDCNICTGGNTGLSQNAGKDCLGICGGSAVVDCHGDCGGSAAPDDCNICSGGNSGHLANSDKDSCGVCLGDGSACGPISCQALEVVGFTLMKSGTAGAIGPLVDGTVINLATIGLFSIRADVCDQPVGSLRFVLNGSSVKVETVFPYAINGDNPVGSYNPYSLAPGIYTLTGQPYSGSGGKGTLGISKTVTFSVINQASTATDCHGDLGGTAFMNPCGICVGGNTGLPVSAGQDCNGDCNGTALLNECGICTGGNTGKGSGAGKDCLGLCGGSAVIDCHGDCAGTAAPDDCSICSGGNSGHLANSDKDSCGVCLGNGSSCATNCGLSVTSLTLMHGGLAGPIDTLFNGYVINRTGLGTFNIRADVCPQQPVGSVQFLLNGAVYSTETSAPYALEGDKPVGNYKSWNPANGNYTLTAIPFSGANATGTAGTPHTVSFAVISAAPMVSKPKSGTTMMEDIALRLVVYPNPNEGNFVVEVNGEEQGEVRLSLYDMAGALVYSSRQNEDAGYSIQKVEVGHLSAGLYMLEVQWGSELSREKIVIR